MFFAPKETLIVNCKVVKIVYKFNQLGAQPYSKKGNIYIFVVILFASLWYLQNILENENSEIALAEKINIFSFFRKDLHEIYQKK